MLFIYCIHFIKDRVIFAVDFLDDGLVGFHQGIIRLKIYSLLVYKRSLKRKEVDLQAISPQLSSEQLKNQQTIFSNRIAIDWDQGCHNRNKLQKLSICSLKCKYGIFYNICKKIPP